MFLASDWAFAKLGPSFGVKRDLNCLLLRLNEGRAFEGQAKALFGRQEVGDRDFMGGSAVGAWTSWWEGSIWLATFCGPLALGGCKLLGSTCRWSEFFVGKRDVGGQAFCWRKRGRYLDIVVRRRHLVGDFSLVRDEPVVGGVSERTSRILSGWWHWQSAWAPVSMASNEAKNRESGLRFRAILGYCFDWLDR